MKTIKYRVEFFSLYDHTGIKTHLERMAEKGWLLEKMGRFLWSYRRIEPKRLTFSVCHLPKGSSFDPEPTEEQQTFYDLCAHTGWVLAAANAQLQVFYNERENPVPIETDPVTAVNSIHRSVKRDELPAEMALLAAAAALASRLLDNPVRVLSTPSDLAVGICWVLVPVLLVAKWGSYFLWYHRAVRAAEQGEFLAPRSFYVVQIGRLARLVSVVECVAFFYFIHGGRAAVSVLLLAVFLYLPAAFLLSWVIRRMMERWKEPAGARCAAATASGFALTLVLLGVMIFGTYYAYDQGWLDGERNGGQTFAGGQDGFTLTIGDLLGVDDDGYDRTVRRAEETFLLGQLMVHQSPRADAENREEMFYLDYTVTLVKAPFLYGLCRTSLLKDGGLYADYFYVPVDAAPWGAQAAYRQEEAERGPQNQYLLCYSDRIVEIQFYLPWGEVTPEQMAIVGEKLGG